ncbi:unnamed protein product [Cuscuta epithymum]|uniref:DUF7815 domain-containing protein n=1 Tax=Cuscuta epithymum TaxID=186058 RepID=A0AAV0F4R0_9ASTE|nr:unnamed protein product [Cuscuta epithymum]
MSHDTLADLIRQVKILTRKESGLPDYDPKDPTLPPLPSVSATVATLDPSPPNLRCKRCRGRLLRGLQSLICIYCGLKQHQKDDPSAPEPISFNSTLSYRLLLQSLRLDGSEKVGPLSEKGEKLEYKRGHNIQKDNICLSELLDFKISLFNNQEKPETDQEQQGNSSLNYNFVDLDSFFPRAKSDNTINPDKNEHEAKTAGTHDHSSFQNAQPLQQAVTPSQNYERDDFSEWEADFRSADSEAPSDSKTFNPATGSTVDSSIGYAIDLSEHMDSIFVKNLCGSEKEDKSKTLHKVSNSSSGDSQSNATTEVFQKKEPFDSKVEVNDYHQQNSSDSLTNVDWFEDKQWPTSLSSAANIGEDSIDEWNDFTSSSNVKDPQGKESTQVENQADFHLDSIVSHTANAPNYNSTDVDGDMFEDWNDFTASTVISENDNAANTSGNVSGLNFFSSNEFGDMDFGNFSHSGTKIPGLDHSMGSNSSSTVDIKDTGKAVVEGDGDDINKMKTKESTPQSDGGNDDVVEFLLSQMHDLSFMLDTNLSIPSKSHSSNPPH